MTNPSDALSALGRLAAVGALAATLGVAGCPEWLEMSDPDAQSERAAPSRHVEIRPAYLPTARARPDGKGPTIPGTPGLRVPEGYFTRIRLDVADMFLPYSYAALLTGEGEVTLRLVAVGGAVRLGGPGGRTLPLPVLRAVVPIELPPGTDLAILSGLTLGEDALRRSTVNLRLTERDGYLIEPSRLTFDMGDRTAVIGTLEGRARRGAKATTWLPIRIGFVALKGPVIGVRR